jgi:N-acetylglucosamine-6-phosphate deacetylase
MAGLVLLRGANVFLPEGRIEPADVLIEDGRIATVAPVIEPPESAEVVDLNGGTLAPGFIDVHVHGGGGFSLLSEDPGEIANYSKWVASRGVTSFLAAVCAGDVEHGIECATAAASARCDGAQLLGVNFEGPFVSPERRGALPEGWLAKPDRKLLDRLLAAAPVRVMTIAPELDGASDLISAVLTAGVRVSVGHSDATYDVAKRAFAEGASHVTHAFNAMRPLHHREPGPVGAAVEAADVTVEVIADGVHLHPATVNLLVRALGPERVCLITDAVTPAGLPSGKFRIGRDEAVLSAGSIRLPGGTIAGSAATMDAVVRNVVEWGVAGVAEVLHMASAVPAPVAGVAARKGKIAPRFDADLVALSADFSVLGTWVGGSCVYRCEEA